MTRIQVSTELVTKFSVEFIYRNWFPNPLLKEVDMRIQCFIFAVVAIIGFTATCSAQEQVSPNPNPAGNSIIVGSQSDVLNSQVFENRGDLIVFAIENPFQNRGLIENHGNFSLPGSIQDSGGFRNRSGGRVFSGGHWESSGRITNEDWFTLQAQTNPPETGAPESVLDNTGGQILNTATGLFDNHGGLLLNRASLINEGRFANDRLGRTDGLAVVRNLNVFQNGSEASRNALFTNAERFENFGSFTNDGIVNDGGASFAFGPTRNFGRTDNSGTITNRGSYRILGELFNSGTFSNERFLGEFQPEFDFISGNTVTSNGRVRNTGTFGNGGVLLLDAEGTFTNDLLFQNAQFSDVFIPLDEFAFEFQNEVTGFVKNKGMFVNNGTVENRGRFENHGDIVNEGLFDSSTGEFENTGSVSGSGEFRGLFRNSGTLEASAASVVFGLDNVVLEETGVLSIQLGGDNFAASGLFEFGNSSLLLNGVFRPVVLDDLVAEIGDTYMFASAGGINMDSSFDTIDHSLAGRYRFAIDAGSNAISVRVIDIVSVPEPTHGTLIAGFLSMLALRRCRS